MAARRAAKANRRKAIVAQRRKDEAAWGTMAGQVARAAALPIQCCVFTEALFETGIGSLVLARGTTATPLVVAGFLLDSFCLGVKDVLFQTMSQRALEIHLDLLGQATPLAQVDPAYGRKLLRDLTRWSASLGFHPPREFAAAERLFGNVDPRACTTEFTFGAHGKPLLISDLSDLEQLNEQFEPDGFEHLIEAE